MPFAPSEEVIVALNKNISSGSCSGVVIGSEGDRIQIALRDRGILVKDGSLVHVSSLLQCDSAAWGSVERLELAGDVKLLSLSSLRFEGDFKVRAARCKVDLSLTVNFSKDGTNAQKTIGQTVDLSLSGFRARFRSPVPQGSPVHVLIHLESGSVLEAVAKVVRIVQGTETNLGGYEVGLEFQRFIRGYDHLISTVPVGKDYPPELSEYREIGEEWVA